MVVTILFTILPNGLSISEELNLFMHKYAWAKVSIMILHCIDFMINSKLDMNIYIFISSPIMFQT